MINIIRKQKSKYYNEKINANNHNSVEMRERIKKLVGGKNTNKITEIYFEDKIEKDENIIAGKFNNYFGKSIENITTKITNQDRTIVIEKMETTSKQKSEFKLLTVCHVYYRHRYYKKSEDQKTSVEGIKTKYW